MSAVVFHREAMYATRDGSFVDLEVASGVGYLNKTVLGKLFTTVDKYLRSCKKDNLGAICCGAQNPKQN